MRPGFFTDSPTGIMQSKKSENPPGFRPIMPILTELYSTSNNYTNKNKTFIRPRDIGRPITVYHPQTATLNHEQYYTLSILSANYRNLSHIF